jgi:hypothetical protein
MPTDDSLFRLNTRTSKTTMTACDSNAITTMILGSALLTGRAMFNVAHATNIRPSARPAGTTVAVSNIRSHNTGKSPYDGRNGLRNEARIKMANQIKLVPMIDGFSLCLMTKCVIATLSVSDN